MCAARLHLVPTPCLHTLSLRLVESCSSYRTRRSGVTRMARRSRAGSGALSFVLVLVLEPRYCRFCRNYRYCWWLPLHTPHHAVLLAGAGSRRGVPAAFAPSRGGDAASTIPHSPGRCPGPRQAITALYPCPHRITEVIMLLKVPNVIRMIALFGTAQ